MLLGDVAGDPDQLPDVAIAIGESGGPDLAPDRAAIFTDFLQFRFEVHGSPSLQITAGLLEGLTEN